MHFSSGTPLTSDDVVGALRRAVTPSTSSRVLAGYVSEIAAPNGVPEISRAGPRSVLIALSRPSASFLAKLTLPAAAIVDMATIHKFGSVWTPHADGLGPFRLVDWSPGSNRAVVEPNPYFPASPAKFHRLTVRFVSPGTAINLFAHKRADVVSGLKASKNLVSRFGARAVEMASDDLEYVALNTARPSLNSVAVRRALALSVDRQALLAQIRDAGVQAEASVVPQTLLPNVKAQVESVPQARKLLGGSANGSTLTLKLTFPTAPDQRTIARFLSRRWRRTLGFKVALDPMKPSEYIRAVRSGQYDMALVRWGNQYPDPANYLETQLVSGAPANVSAWSSAPFDGLVQRSDGLGIDAKARAVLLRNAAAIATTQSPWIPLASPARLALVGPRLSGLQLEASGLLEWSAAGIRTPGPASH